MLYAKKQKLKKVAGLSALGVLGVLILAAGIIAGVWFLTNNADYNKAMIVFNSGDVDTAHGMFAELGSFRDAADYVKNIELEKQSETLKTTLADKQVGDYVKLGSYEQDNDLSNGNEEIEWQVIDRQDNILTLITLDGIECIQYNKKNEPTVWANCTLRKWLNEGFISKAFSEEMSEMIIDTDTPADPNPDYPNTPTGEDTVDKVYCLSRTEAMTYFTSGSWRSAKPSAYCLAKGAYRNHNSGYAWWWLRTPGVYENKCCLIVDWGSPYKRGGEVNATWGCVRPAMRIDIDKMNFK